MSDTIAPEKHEFQAEVQQLLQLMIHSLYSNKEIFLRELISNASDATDKLRFAGLTNEILLQDSGETDIRLSINTDARTVTLADRGIGMTHDEVIENIGTIARSGTKKFMHSMTGEGAKDVNLIGQFGVGFYSAFMVADKVTMRTRKAGEPVETGVEWRSDGGGSYEISAIDKEENGTEIILHLRDGEDEYLQPHRLRHIVNTYSDHIPLEIKMPKTAADADDDDNKDDSIIDVPEWEVINKGSALWARPRNEITTDEYSSFYQSLSYDAKPPLSILHNRVEGKTEYISLFFIPNKAPFDMWDRERRHGVKLYVKRIFITDDAENLLPAYLRFVRGIVDCADLPLNVSREFLQKNKDIDQIRGASTKKLLSELKKLSEDDGEKYQGFWNEFGRAMKEGVVEDFDNQKTIAELLRFTTSKNGGSDQTVSLAEYVKRMPVKQKAIYYITGDTPQATASSPHLEIFKQRDVEVLLLSDPIDEWLVNHLTEYEETPLKSVARGALDFEDEEDNASKDDDKKENKTNNDELIAKLKDALGDSVKEVRASKRLVDSPGCLIADENDLGGNLQRLLKSMGQDAPDSKPILEINLKHDLVSTLQPDNPDLSDWAHVLFDQAALSEGAPLKDAAMYVKRVNKLLSRQA